MSMADVGFIILRHVTSRMTDMYWKECYRCIRRWYPQAPVMIVDDSSSEWLQEDLMMTRCTVVYDRENPGRGELLPYLYFHRLKPFRRAIIVHDSVFLQAPLKIGEAEGIQFLWSIPHHFDYSILQEIRGLIDALPSSVREEVHELYGRKDKWCGAFGVMSVVSWELLNEIVERYDLFRRWLPLLQKRDDRSALERVLGLVFYHHAANGSPVAASLHGDILKYIHWGVSFTDWLKGGYEQYPVMKVWSGR